MKKEKHTLTPKQEAFALEYVLNGRDATAAYRKVYDTKTDNDKVVWINAHKVKVNAKVALRIHELEMLEFDDAILTILERKKILTKLGKSGCTKSIDLLNKMEAVYTEKVELSGSIDVNNLSDRLKGK